MDDEGLGKGSGAMDGTTSGNGRTERQGRAGALKAGHGAVRPRDMGSTLSYFFLVQLVFANMQDGIGLDRRRSKRFWLLYVLLPRIRLSVERTPE